MEQSCSVVVCAAEDSFLNFDHFCFLFDFESKNLVSSYLASKYSEGWDRVGQASPTVPVACIARVWAPRKFTYLGPYFPLPSSPAFWVNALQFHLSALQCTSLTSFRQLPYSKDFRPRGILRQRESYVSPFPPTTVTHPLFFSLSLFGIVSSFLLNSLKLLTSMMDVGNVFHMLASLWSASSSRLCL